MKYKNLPSNNYKENRKFLRELNSHSIAVFNSNDIYPISSDATLPFEQHRDIFYLTGIDQEETVLLLHKGETEKECKEIVFVKETNKHIAIWEGEKLTKENTTKISGISNVEWTDSFEKIFNELEKNQNTFILTLMNITELKLKRKLEKTGLLIGVKINTQIKIT